MCYNRWCVIIDDIIDDIGRDCIVDGIRRDVL